MDADIVCNNLGVFVVGRGDGIGSGHLWSHISIFVGKKKRSL